MGETPKTYVVAFAEGVVVLQEFGTVGEAERVIDSLAQSGPGWASAFVAIALMVPSANADEANVS
jgi:hypothetical protein